MEHDAFWVQTGSERAGRVKENDEGLGLSTKIMEAEAGADFYRECWEFGLESIGTIEGEDNL